MFTYQKRPSSRGSRVGFYMPEGEEGVDFVIAISTKENGMAAILQVKNFKNSISETSKNNFFQKFDVSRCAPVHPEGWL